MEGIEVFLGNNMCQDHHVEDLLACLESFLGRTIPRPWRIGRLDLARNGLSDESIFKIIERMKMWSLRLKHLHLDSNHIGQKGLKALVEYVWNCPEPISEIGLSGNSIEANAADSAEDPVSALIRCVYNHPVYPLKSPGESGPQIVPLTLRLGDNKIENGHALLDKISDKGGPAHVHFPKSPEPYAAVGEVFLSVFLPDYERQGAAAAVPAEAPIPPIEEYPAGEAAAPAETQQLATKSNTLEDDEYSEYSDESESDQEDPPAPIQAAAAVQAMTAQGSAPVMQPDPGIDSGDESSSYSDEEAEEEAQPQLDNVEEGEEVDGEAAPAEIMPDDMLKALDILEAAADVQIGREREAAANAQVQPQEDSKLDDSDESVAVKSDDNADRVQDKPAGEDVPSDPASPPEKRIPVETDAYVTDVVVDSAVAADEEPKKTQAAGSKKLARPAERSLPEQPKLLLKKVKLGHRADGKVTLVRERFALVECGVEVEGLLHTNDLNGCQMSELSIGDIIRVEVSGLCKRRKRVSLRQVDTQGSLQATQATEAAPEKKRRRVRKSQKRRRQQEQQEAGGEKKRRRRKNPADGDEPPHVGNGDHDDRQLPSVGVKAKSKPKRRQEEAAESGNPAATVSTEDSFGDVLEGTLTDEEERHLQRDVIAKLNETTGLKMEEEDRSELAEFVVSALKEGKRPSEVKEELAALIPSHAEEFTAWLVDHIKGPWVEAARSRTGAKPKAAARKG